MIDGLIVGSCANGNSEVEKKRRCRKVGADNKVFLRAKDLGVSKKKHNRGEKKKHEI